MIVSYAQLVNSVALDRRIEVTFAKRAHIVQEVLILVNTHVQQEPMVEI